MPQSDGCRLIAGVDEAGRGPLAGNVFAAAVILAPDRPLPGLNDSKKLSATRRQQCYNEITGSALTWAVAKASVAEIDTLNILHASLLAMQRAVAGLAEQPDFVYVDGNCCPGWDYRSSAVVGGDARLQCIAAASILAKVARDREMVELEECFPGYGFARHKGYPTRDHLAALARLGPCDMHRRSFKPVADLLPGGCSGASV
ncbi:MAG: ribonuclease HII [Gammaproteobacteria bacterium]|nr:ribonuclease HII [Pseudomonadales bacterium]MCP5346410.1 ribonuclease HII [Pseudomonadales bacterium]